MSINLTSDSNTTAAGASAKSAPMDMRLVFWALSSALAGFLFGFDAVVISGAEQKIQALFNLDDRMHGYLMGSALYGTVIGSLAGGWPTDKFGRKKTLLFVGLLFVVSAIGCGFANSAATLIAARVIGGFGIGVSTIAAPLYISEIAPPAHRGRLAGMFQFNIVFGIMVAFGSNWLLADIGVNAWRWMLGVAAVPSVIYTLLCFGIPESPRWLLTRKHDRTGGIKVLKLLQPTASESEIAAQVTAITTAVTEQKSSEGFWSWRLRVPIMLAFFVAFFNQMSGINAILFFAPRIFEMTGLQEKSALLQSIGIGFTNLVFTFAGLWLIDRLGRRTLLFIGSYGYILSLGLVSWAFFTERYVIVPYCIFAFIAAHAVGQGAVIWVLISEVFPNRYRAEGQALGSFTHWIFAAVMATYFAQTVKAFAPGYVFAFFCAMMVLQLLWVQFFVIETKGVPLELVQKRLGVE